MQAAMFCSNCGEQIKSRRARFLPFGPVCARCAPAFRLARFVLCSAFAFFIAVVFVIGRLTATREPFYIIGTPLDLNSTRNQPQMNQNGPRSAGESGNP